MRSQTGYEWGLDFLLLLEVVGLQGTSAVFNSDIMARVTVGVSA